MKVFLKCIDETVYSYKVFTQREKDQIIISGVILYNGKYFRYEGMIGGDAYYYESECLDLTHSLVEKE